MKIKQLLLALLLLLTLISCNTENETIYKGVVVDKHYVDPSSGYKTYSEEQYQIYLREDITKQVIKVNVNVPTYYNLEKGSRTAFKISNMNMYVLGNTSNQYKNLYGE